MWDPFTSGLRWVTNNLEIPAKLRLDPMPTTPGVTLVDPGVLDSRELSVGTMKQQRHTSAILNVGSVDSCAQHEATAID
jgi:hypothetical protein